MNATFSPAQPPDIFKLLAHDVRWKILMHLAHSDHRVQELVRLTEQPQNLVSYHLKQLRDHGLVIERRSTADRRDIYYNLDLMALYTHYYAAAEVLHPALIQAETNLQEVVAHLPDKPIRVLFLCTENSARSQMAEALLRHLSKGRVEAYSAGSHPSSIHPYAVRALTAMGIDASQQSAKHFDIFRGQSFDRIITVCDRVVELCPTFPGDPEHIHWSFPDPASVEGTEEVRYHAFEQTALQLTTRIRLLLTLLEREKGKHV